MDMGSSHTIDDGSTLAAKKAGTKVAGIKAGSMPEPHIVTFNAKSYDMSNPKDVQAANKALNGALRTGTLDGESLQTGAGKTKLSQVRQELNGTDHDTAMANAKARNFTDSLPRTAYVSTTTAQA